MKNTIALLALISIGFGCVNRSNPMLSVNPKCISLNNKGHDYLVQFEMSNKNTDLRDSAQFYLTLSSECDSAFITPIYNLSTLHFHDEQYDICLRYLKLIEQKSAYADPFLLAMQAVCLKHLSRIQEFDRIRTAAVFSSIAELHQQKEYYQFIKTIQIIQMTYGNSIAEKFYLNEKNNIKNLPNNFSIEELLSKDSIQ